MKNEALYLAAQKFADELQQGFRPEIPEGVIVENDVEVAGAKVYFFYGEGIRLIVGYEPRNRRGWAVYG
jgi:hypothetical protein